MRRFRRFVALWSCSLFFACGARSELPVAERCGNGVLEGREECDDGNDAHGDGCTPQCTLSGCGDGVVDPEEQCDLGPDNGDRFALLLRHAGSEQSVMPIDRAATSATFYAYFSESSHTGLERVDLAALFLYRDTGSEQLGLITHFGIDADATGMVIDHGLVDMIVDGVPPGAFVTVGDEPDELLFESPDRLVGHFEFWENTDGGGIEPLPFPGEWEIHVRVDLLLGIGAWSYMLADTTEVALDPAEEAILIAHATPSPCRTDCTIPRCGDAIVDGGEVCDDGNTVPGDGCGSDCTTLNGP
jgi:cysteine-rich repeat protein